MQVEHGDHQHAIAVPTVKDGRVPVTILTGFLGSGKTTLLNWILSSDEHKLRIAVIENEFGEIGIDDKLVKQRVQTGEEQIVEMNNGCICCTVRVDLMLALESLSEKKGKFDAIIIETTGMADPTPVCQTFFMDEDVAKFARLDAVVTVVDAHHICAQLDAPREEGTVNESQKQIAFADRIIINKIDLLPADDEGRALADIRARLTAINSLAEQCTVSLRTAPVPMDFVLGLDKFSLDRVLELKPDFLTDRRDTMHDASISSVGLRIPGDLGPCKLNDLWGSLLEDRGQDLLRYKGILALHQEAHKYVLHGVHMMYDGTISNVPWGPDEKRQSEIVFIGHNLDGADLERRFRDCLVTPGGPLRFAVGTRVEARVEEGWKGGVIAKTWETGLPYVIQLDGKKRGKKSTKKPKPGICVFAPEDHDTFVRLPEKKFKS